MNISQEDGRALLVEIVATCDRLEQDLLRRKLVVVDAIDAQRPGASENPDDAHFGWLAFHNWLLRTHAAGQRSESRASTSSERAAAEAALSASLADAPEAVTLASGDVVHVHPLSLWALQWLDLLSVQAGISLEHVLAARELQTPEDIAVLHIAPLAQAMPLRLWAWVVCSKGPALPFDDETELLEPPAWTKELMPEDLLALFRAHRNVNGTRINLVSSYLAPDPADPQRGPALSVAGFIGSVAGEGGDPGAALRLMRTTSVGMIFASKIAAAKVARDARQRAKEDAERNKGG
jgi:hypothetical protein